VPSGKRKRLHARADLEYRPTNLDKFASVAAAPNTALRPNSLRIAAFPLAVRGDIQHKHRMTRVLAAVAALLILLVALPESRQARPGGLRAGAAKVEITPKASDLAVATDSIRDPLFARAIVVDEGTTCAVLVGLDLGGAATAMVADATTRAAAATGCPAGNILISATHTHSSNPQGLGQGPPLARTVADAIVQAATTAKSKLAPARVGYGTTRIDLNVNRDLFNSKLEWRQEPASDRRFRPRAWMPTRRRSRVPASTSTCWE
jgi:hypothetical protein